MICAITPHIVFEFAQPRIDISIIRIADAIGKEAKKQGLKTLGLLGSKPTVTKNFIPKILREKYGIETIIPEEHCLSQAHVLYRKNLPRVFFLKKPGNSF
ncbi:aspartate/glutamate racemase family protein [Gramella lutea]|uniref:Aspartate/glutamate racemase family protein n=1 Tax=Christiangramia lutea TaxID=1607951 RepID=A0A9X1V3M5_9FLAO|nr:aspartate/glutamate racemase family protein [Christiangramia lutea]